MPLEEKEKINLNQLTEYILEYAETNSLEERAIHECQVHSDQKACQAAVEYKKGREDTRTEIEKLMTTLFSEEEKKKE
jgi:hypothetical protein